MDLFDDVPLIGSPFPPYAGYRLVVLPAGRSHFHHALLLQRRLRVDASGSRRLLRPQERLFDVLVNDRRLGVRQRARAVVDHIRREATGTYTRVLYIIMGIMLVSSIIAVHCSVSKKELDGTAETEARA